MLNPGPNPDQLSQDFWDEPSQAQALLMEEKQAQITSEQLIKLIKRTHQHPDQETEHHQYSEVLLPVLLTPSKRDHHADSDTMSY